MVFPRLIRIGRQPLRYRVRTGSYYDCQETHRPPAIMQGRRRMLSMERRDPVVLMAVNGPGVNRVEWGATARRHS